MARHKRLSDDDLVTLVLQESDKAMGSEFATDELVENRKQALRYYQGKKRGDEIEGSSQVISKDVADTIDSMLAQLMPIFSSDDIVQFEPLSEDDEEQARVESSFVNHMIMAQNSGFMLFQTLIKDTLLSKNCYAKVRIDENVNVEKEKYSGLSEDELVMVMQPRSEEEEVKVTDFDEVKGIANLTRTTTKRKLVVEGVAPENMAVTNDQNEVNLENCRYCRERYFVSRSDLIEAGYPRNVVKDLPASSTETQLDAVERNNAGQNERNYYHTNESMQIIEVEDHYMRVDRDGDGIAELWKVVTSNRRFLEATEVDVIPYASGVSFLMGHRHYGQSVYDKLKEVQDIKTHFLRQWADNALTHNHNKTDVIEEQVNMEDFLNARPDGLRRVESLDSARDVVPHDIGPSCQSALNYWDKVRTDRTGATLAMQGNQMDMPSNVGNQGVNTLVQNLERVTSLISKNFSESLVTSLYTLTHHFLRVNFPNKIQARISGNWTDSNPAEWRERNQVNLTLPPTESEKIVIQTGVDKAILMAMNDMQQGLTGITTDAGNLYQMRLDSLRLSGVDRPEKYLLNPESPESMQAQQQMQQQQMVQQQQMEAERQQDRQFAQQLQIKQVEIAESEIQRNWKNDIEELQVRMAELQQKTEFEFAKLVTDTNAGRESDNLDSQTKLTIAGVNNKTTKEVAELGAIVDTNNAQVKAKTDSDSSMMKAQSESLQRLSDEEIAEAKLLSDIGSKRESDSVNCDNKKEIASISSQAQKEIAELNAIVNTNNANIKATTDHDNAIIKAQCEGLKRESDEEIAEAKMVSDGVIKMEMDSIKKMKGNKMEMDDDE